MRDLYRYPFEPKNVEIRIFLKGPDGRAVLHGELSVVSAIGGVFSYEIDNYETKLFTEVLQETYEEAKKKVVQKLD